ncbi:MAG: YicC/YloC family endoribonuclease, partial [Pyrinomonadaceae bacterium]
MKKIRRLLFLRKRRSLSFVLCSFDDPCAKGRLSTPEQSTKYQVQRLELVTRTLKAKINTMKSMTGYGRGSVAGDGFSASVDLKTVNNRFLDIHLRIGGELAALEPVIKKRISSRLAR